ncbi:MAG: hypothetical protein SGARI_002244, partial [Bacillariaceae sp.]
MVSFRCRLVRSRVTLLLLCCVTSTSPGFVWNAASGGHRVSLSSSDSFFSIPEDDIDNQNDDGNLDALFKWTEARFGKEWAPDLFEKFATEEFLHLCAIAPHLASTFPTEIGLMTCLTKIQGHKDDLVGTLPTEIGSLTKLTHFSIGKWHVLALEGPMPTELGQLTALTHLDLSFQDFTGTIPTELGKLTKLEFLDLGPTDLTDLGLFGNDLT